MLGEWRAWVRWRYTKHSWRTSDLLFCGFFSISKSITIVDTGRRKCVYYWKNNSSSHPSLRKNKTGYESNWVLQLGAEMYFPRERRKISHSRMNQFLANRYKDIVRRCQWARAVAVTRSPGRGRAARAVLRRLTKGTYLVVDISPIKAVLTFLRTITIIIPKPLFN